MKVLMFVALILAPSPATASYRPTVMQEAEIDKHIDQGLSAANALREDPKVQEAKDLKRRLEAEMGVPLDANGNATRAPTEAELKRLKGFWHDRRGDYTRAAKSVDDLVRTRDYNLNRAAELAQEYFQINTPRRSSGVVRFNTDPPELGSHWQWRLRFDGGPPPDKSHTTGAWVSPEDGAVNLRAEAFSSPALLAFAIVHEALHYHIRLADSEYGLLRREEEVFVNFRALRHVSDFGLKSQEVRAVLLATAEQHVMALDDRRRMAQGQAPKSPHGGFGLELTKEGLAETRRAVDADLAALDGVLASGITDEELESLKAGAQSEFVKGLDKSELVDLAIAWRSARENDAMQPGRDAQFLREQQEEAARARGRQIAEAAVACGFSVASDGDFYAQGGSLRVYHSGEVDRARAALLLIDACQREGRPEAGPCNDAIGIVAARWAEPKFKDSMMVWKTNAPFIDAESALGQCLWDLHKTWTPRGDFADLKSAVEGNRARRLAARPKPPAPQTPREPRPPRESPPPSRGGGQCYQSNDGREICP